MSGPAAGTCRAYLVDQLRQDHPTWVVEAAPEFPAQVQRDRPHVAVWRDLLTPGPSSLNLVHNMTVNLVQGKTTGVAAEDDLDGLLDALLVSLQGLPLFEFVSAERSTFKGAFSGYEVRGRITTENYIKRAATEAARTNDAIGV